MVKVKGVKLPPTLKVGEYHLMMSNPPSDVYRILRVVEGAVEPIGFIRVEIKWEKRQEANDEHWIPQDSRIVILSDCDTVPMEDIKNAIMATIKNA